MTKIIKKDLYRYVGSSVNHFLVRWKMILFSPGCTFIYFLRKAQAKSIFHPFWNVCHRLWMWHTGIQIPVATQIGEGFRILHFGTIVINQESVIGRNFNIAQGCLVGGNRGKKEGFPTIGDNVYMFANSIVVGGGESWKQRFDCSWCFL